MLIQPIEAVRPELAVALHPFVKSPERLRRKTARALLGHPSPRNQTRILQHVQVPGKRGSADFESFRQPFHWRFASAKLRQNFAPHRVRKCGKRSVQIEHYLTIALLNTYVKYEATISREKLGAFGLPPERPPICERPLTVPLGELE